MPLTLTINDAWNHNIAEAPRDKGEPVWLATKCGKVIQSYFLPSKKEGQDGRWAYLASKEEPIAWQMFIKPVHPNLSEASASLSGSIAEFLTIIEDVGGE
jgi:hypothetical protein